ncbi:MAG TPA: ABC transporter ATP-binding protein, partial [Acidimicrobiales bacterium]|nr:ABC transporter ATP-binding protein [Acidimicrobiales bacterium]
MILNVSDRVQEVLNADHDLRRASGDSIIEFIRLEEIHKVYTRGVIEVPVLRGVSLSIARREMVAIMGVSGSGKTTLINLLGFLDRPTSGRHWLEGQDVTRLGETERAWLRSREIGFVFQNFNLLPRMTALENVMIPSVYGSHDFSERECRARARVLLERVGLGDRIDHEPSQLSGGEQQRVAIARALINRCSLLITDEPTGNLDSKTGEEILGLFRQLNREDGLTIVLVTHDPTVAAHADRILRIRDGLVFDDDCLPDEPPGQTRSAGCGRSKTRDGALQPTNQLRSN